MSSPKIKAIFFDRDGTLIKDFHYNHDIESQLEILPGVVETMTKLSSLGYHFLIITNQSGIGRGYFGHEDYQKFQSELIKRLANEDIDVDDTFYCPHAPGDGCECRKPNPTQINKAIKTYNINRKLSYFVGDKDEDVLAGKNANLTTVRLTSGYPTKIKADYVIESFEELSKIIKA